jgi:hypothetical protein
VARSSRNEGLLGPQSSVLTALHAPPELYAAFRSEEPLIGVRYAETDIPAKKAAIENLPAEPETDPSC